MDLFLSIGLDALSYVLTLLLVTLGLVIIYGMMNVINMAHGELFLLGEKLTAEQAYAKIRAGAAAVQLYTALVYGGLSLAADIARGLDALLARDGFGSVAAAVGTGRGDWL